MMSIIDKNREDIIALCNKYNVANLFVFGSVLSPQFNKESDIDFLVDFCKIDLPVYADNYFDFKESLENLLNRQIDLLEDKAIMNPYLRISIDASKMQIYGHRN